MYKFRNGFGVQLTEKSLSIFNGFGVQLTEMSL